MTRVAVLMGGITGEREISLRTGLAISGALKRLGYDVIDIDVGKDVVSKLLSVKPDKAVIALHGKYGEDGCIQGLLELLEIPYTGCGVLGSAVGMDKTICSMVAEKLGVPVPKGKIYHRGEEKKPFIKDLEIEFPVIVKPACEGSTINVTIVEKEDELAGAIDSALKSDGKVIVEKYIKGIEVTVGIVNGRALTALEVAPKCGFYDYKSKYTKGMTEYIVPARIGENEMSKVKEYSLKIYNAIDGKGIARADFIIADDKTCYFLEINTIPGMTELSLVPKAANHDGISFDELVKQLIEGAGLKEI